MAEYVFVQAISQMHLGRQSRRGSGTWPQVAEAIVFASDNRDWASKLADSLAESQLGEVVERGATVAPRQAGRLASAFTAENESDRLRALFAAMNDRRLPKFLEGLLVSGFRESWEDPAASVAIQAGLRTEAATRVVAQSPLRGRLLKGQEVQEPDVALRVLSSCSDLWSDEEVGILMSIIGWSVDDYGQALSLVEHRLDPFADHADSALASMDLPQAQAVPDDKLRMLVETLLRGGVVEHIDDPEEDHLERLLRHRNQSIKKMACQWVRHRPVSAQAVEMVRAAAESSAVLKDEFQAARTDQAERLVAAANDDDRTWEERIDALVLAARASPGVASSAAIALLESPRREMRLRAARLLADAHPPSDEDITRVRTAIERETERDVRQVLESALRRVNSGDEGEALRNLFILVGLDPAEAPSIDVMLPAKEQRGQFVAAVDKCRSDQLGTPHSYVTSLAVLADQLAEFAALARSEVEDGILKELEAKGIRNNTGEKPDAGELIRRQKLIQEFGWFQAVGTLREKRYAHSAPRGSSTPHEYDSTDIEVGTGLLRAVVRGWKESMVASATMAE